jgi:hypothetical protein
MFRHSSSPHSRKDLQLVRGGAVIPTKKPSAEQIKADKIGKAAYNPVLKDLMGSRVYNQCECWLMP